MLSGIDIQKCQAWRPVGWLVSVFFAPSLRTRREGEDTSENYLVASDDTEISVSGFDWGFLIHVF